MIFEYYTPDLQYSRSDSQTGVRLPRFPGGMLGNCEVHTE